MEATAVKVQGDPAERLERPGILRAGLVLLGLPQLAIGLWALISPSGWYGTFPGFGREWLPAYGSFDEHLATDVGATFLAIGVLMLLAALWLDRRVVQAALVAYLAFEIPHFAFHLGADDVLPTGDRIASWVALALTVALASLLLALARRRPHAAARASDRGGNGSARIAPREKGLLPRVGRWYARRQYGRELTPAGVYAHHPKLALGYGTFEATVERSHRVPDRLKLLAEIKASTLASCEWCMDFGSHLAPGLGIDERLLRELPRYRDSDAFSDLEKLVLDYAVGMTRTPADVPDELFARLREHFDDAQLVELTNVIAIENLRSRFNLALGIEAQGFSDGAFCVVPEAGEVEVASGAS
jgi:alkylhydroperoxidase family enzyme